MLVTSDEKSVHALLTSSFAPPLADSRRLLLDAPLSADPSRLRRYSFFLELVAIRSPGASRLRRFGTGERDRDRELLSRARRRGGDVEREVDGRLRRRLSGGERESLE